MIPTYFNNNEDENREVTYNALDGKKRKFMGSTGLGMGIGAVYELVKLRKKILARWQKQCEKAIARGEPCPPRPDTSRGALMAILRGSVKGAVLGGAVGFLPGAGKAANDLEASIHATTNKLMTGNKGGYSEKYFSYIETFIPEEDYFSDNVNYTLSYLTDQDFSEINTDNLDIGIVQPRDVLKAFFSMADAANKMFTKEELYYYFSNKNNNDTEDVKLVQNNPMAKADEKMFRLSNAALPVLGAVGGGAFSMYKARKRALERWEQIARKNAAEGKPIPPKPAILEELGSGVKGALAGGTAGWLASKTGLGKDINSKLSEKLDKFGLVNRKTGNADMKKLQKDQKKEAKKEAKEAKKVNTEEVKEENINPDQPLNSENAKPNKNDVLNELNKYGIKKVKGGQLVDSNGNYLDKNAWSDLMNGKTTVNAIASNVSSNKSNKNSNESNSSFTFTPADNTNYIEKMKKEGKFFSLAQEFAIENFNFSYNDYREALLRKGIVTTMTKEEFYSTPVEHFSILLENMM